MNTLKTSVLFVVVAIALCAAADAPVAVRVEIESLAVGTGGTDVVLTVQISPEDRSRIGKNAMVRVTLDGDVPPRQSPLWAVRIEDDGSGRIETVWPPGEHALRVEIASPSGEHTGLWVGSVRIPGVETDAVGPEVESPAPEMVPTPEAKIDGAAAAASSVIADAPSATPVIEEPVEVSETIEEVVPEQAVLETEQNPELAQTQEPLPEPEVQVETEVASEVEPPPSIPDEVAIEVEAEVRESVRSVEAPMVVAGAVGTIAATAPETTVETPAEPETSVIVEPPPVADVADIEPDVATVEPLRAESPQPGVDPGTAIAPSPESSEEAPEPPPAAVAAALEAWAEADPATADLTVIARRENKPATGLAPSDFSLRVGGKDALIEEVGGSDRAPLQLGIAVDVATGSGAGWSQSGGRLFPLVQRARAGRGHVFFAADGRVGAWDGDPEDSRGGGASATYGGLTSLIVDSLERFKGRRGRNFLIVVTDGRADADKAAWKAAIDAASNAGCPVLIIALWDDNFSQKIRKHLKTIADTSGGSLFLVQGSDQLDRAAERFGPMIDAGVALRFVVPPGVVLPASVSVEGGDKELKVTAPKGVR